MSVTRASVIAVACFIAAATLIGCAPGRHESTAQVPLPDSFSTEGEAVLPSRWWRHFDDQALNRLESAAMAGSFSMAAARARLRQARAVVRIEGADLKPSLDGTVEASDQRNGSTGGDSYSAGLVAGYEVDLWGGVAAEATAARLEAQATRFDLRAAAVSLTAEVATTYYTLLRQRAVVALLQRQLEVSEQIAELVRVRYRNGQANLDELLRQRQLSEQTATRLETARGEVQRQRTDLAALVGRPPEALALPAGHERVMVPPRPAIGVPAGWLRERPDLAAAYLRVRSADAEVASAIAAQYPSLDLSASLTSSALAPAALFEDWVTQLAASLAVPLIRGGALEAQVERDRAARAVAFNEYAQAAVDAAAEVEQALIAERTDRRVLQGLERELELAERAHQQLRLRYLKGAANYLDVLDALSSLQDTQRDVLEARWELLLDRIALIRTVAGGGFGETGLDSTEGN
ncbi:efflux transporter outer membrane subunit [Arhodomonas sp. AD133]|uniref:efflux transporter outer membrane subunit n=1 Tax=Arhodomonas sp. AD133 TaxID=3415009 RepID=UPI003EBF7E9C